MEFAVVKGALTEAAEALEKANADLEPELVSIAEARGLLASYARVEKLVAYGTAALARRIDDPRVVAQTTSTTMGRARGALETGRRLRAAPQVEAALRSGELSLDQAGPIAKAEEARPGSARGLLQMAKDKPLWVLKDEARKVVLEAQSPQDLATRQHEARSGSWRKTDLGMIHLEADLEPHLGTPLLNRWEAEARRLAKEARKQGGKEPFAAHLADALVAMLEGKGKGSTTRPELVVLVSHEVAARGWDDVRAGEVCTIPGVGPISPSVAKQIATRAFCSAVVFDGKDLRHFRRWTRNIPIEVRVALELGEPPGFDGMKCVDCGSRFRNERDHDDPHANGGPASVENLKPRCWPCHKAKTERDRRAGKLRPTPERRRKRERKDRGPP